jgi:hypothetical protein
MLKYRGIMQEIIITGCKVTEELMFVKFQSRMNMTFLSHILLDINVIPLM